MLKNICSEKTVQKSQTFVGAKRKARPDKRGKRSSWKKHESQAQGRRVGQVDERGKMNTNSREFRHLWERLRQWYQLESAKGREWSEERAAESFKNELEDETNSLEAKGESCSPAELCIIQQGERRLENRKKRHNWKALVACAKYELQIAHGRKGKERHKKGKKGKEQKGQR